MPPPPVALQISRSLGETGSSSASQNLSTSDIIAIAVGVPSGIFALFGVFVAFLAWKYPDRFRKTKNKWISLSRPYPNKDNWTNYGDVETVVGGNVDGGFHRNNHGQIIYG
ncbi:hypothetical protein ANO14919_059150 [Xylariales sp. No.14919]|nr:hypothetical protein ANO14919_059150 [Xylariales sp. No.14919]